jgi:hypothetical protein
MAHAPALQLLDRPRPGRVHLGDVPAHVILIGQRSVAGPHRDHVDVVRPGPAA